MDAVKRPNTPFRVLCGGGWPIREPLWVLAASRIPRGLLYRYNNIGFRCNLAVRAPR
jgi:hypothetical protein